MFQVNVLAPWLSEMLSRHDNRYQDATRKRKESICDPVSRSSSRLRRRLLPMSESAPLAPCFAICD